MARLQRCEIDRCVDKSRAVEGALEKAAGKTADQVKDAAP